MITSLKQRNLVKEAAQEIHDRATRANRSLTAKESQDFDDFLLDVKEWDERQSSVLSSGSTRGADGFAHPKASGSGSSARYYTNDSDVYSDPHQNPDSPSF